MGAVISLVVITALIGCGSVYFKWREIIGLHRSRILDASDHDLRMAIEQSRLNEDQLRKALQERLLRRIAKDKILKEYIG